MSLSFAYSLNVKNLPLEMHSAVNVNVEVKAVFVCMGVVASVEYHHIFLMKIVGKKMKQTCAMCMHVCN